MPETAAADVDASLVDDQPPSLHTAEFRKLEVDHNPPLRKRFGFDEAVNVPH